MGVPYDKGLSTFDNINDDMATKCGWGAMRREC